MKYLELVDVYEKLENTSRRLEKIKVISELIKKTNDEDLQTIMLLIEGRVFPKWDNREIGVAARIVLKAIAKATGNEEKKVEKEWSKKGDLGLVVETFVSNKKQATLGKVDITIKKVFCNLQKLASLKGIGTVGRKLELIVELLSSAEPKESKYVVRTLLQDLRIGVGEGSIRDAIVWAYFGNKLNIKYNKEKNDLEINEEERKRYNEYITILQDAYDITNDFSEVSIIAKNKGLEGLKKVSLKAGKPIKVMLYQKAKDIEDAFEKVGKPAALEYKYDGFRLQLHRDKGKIKLYTRRLENVTEQFPDVVKAIEENVKSENYILDAEIIGIDKKTKKWLAFQNISQRIKRKYGIEETSKDVPVMVNLFDAILIDRENLLKSPFSERRNKLRKIVKEVPEKIQLADQIITENLDEAEKFYNESLDKGNEGIMAKALDKPYKPGSRVGYGVKIKPVMETLDLAIVGAEWGEGKRAKWLSSFTIACIDEEGEYLEIGKVGTGIKEKEEEGISFKQLTDILKPLIIREKGKEVKVKPKIVIEVNYEEIQKSNNYSSGYALRFPRLVRLREDRDVDDISDISFIEELYHKQRSR